MKRTTYIAAGLAAALALGFVPAIVNAHPHGQGPGQGMGPRGVGNPAATAEARLAHMKSELKINPGQEAAWNAFADWSKQQAEAMRAWRTTMQGSTQATAPERMELHNQIMKQRQEHAEKKTAAFKDLYAALTLEQKAIADQRFAGGPSHGSGFRGGPGRHFR